MLTKNMEQQFEKLNKSSLHHSLSDSVFNSMNFLNEVIERYPNAISFAPGAPYAGFFDNLNITEYIDLYVEYVKQKKGASLSQVQRWLYQYGPTMGYINELVANALRDDENINVPPESIVITVGCQEAILITLRTLFATQDDILIVVQPCYLGIIGAARLLNIDIRGISEDEDKIDLNQIKILCQAIRAEGKRVKALYIAPDFSNPSGTQIDLETRHQLLSLAESENFFLLEDSTYGFTASESDYLPSLKSLDQNTRVIYLNTFAKTCLPGARVGFVVADQILVDTPNKTQLLAKKMAAVKSMTTINTSPICQAIIGGMLLKYNGSLAALGREKAQIYQHNLKCLLNALNKHLNQKNIFNKQVSWNTPKGGFFVRMRLPVNVDEKLLHISAEKYGVLWTPMSHFYINNTTSNELRLSCSYLTDDEIEEGVRRLALFLQDCCVNNSPGYASNIE